MASIPSTPAGPQGSAVPVSQVEVSVVIPCLNEAANIEQCVRRSLAALDELVVAVVPTTAPAARAVLSHPDFAAAAVTTRWLESSVELPTTAPATTPDTGAGEGNDAGDTGQDTPRAEVWVGGRRYIIPFFRTGAPAVADPGRTARPSRAGGDRRRTGTGNHVGPGAGVVTSPMQGTVVAVNVADGDTVIAGQVLFVVEAMKMLNPVRAGAGGVLAQISVEVGDVVAAGAELAALKQAA